MQKITPLDSELSNSPQSPLFNGGLSPSSNPTDNQQDDITLKIVDNNRRYERSIDPDSASSPQMSPVDTPNRKALSRQAQTLESLGSFGKFLYSSSGEESAKLMFGTNTEPIVLTSV